MFLCTLEHCLQVNVPATEGLAPDVHAVFTQAGERKMSWGSKGRDAEGVSGDGYGVSLSPLDYRRSGECRELPRRVWGTAPAQNEFDAFL